MSDKHSLTQSRIVIRETDMPDELIKTALHVGAVAVDKFSNERGWYNVMKIWQKKSRNILIKNILEDGTA